MERDMITVPVIALRGLTVLPRMMMHFDISRPKSILAVEKAMGGDQKAVSYTHLDVYKRQKSPCMYRIDRRNRNMRMDRK